MLFDEYLQLSPYSLNHREKEGLLTGRLVELTEFHRQNCPEYAAILGALGYDRDGVGSYCDLPFLPVRLFKELSLKSVPHEDIVKTMTSSGTSGQAVSKIYLDRATSANQQKVMVKIVSDFTGSSRMPMVILDCPSVVKDRRMFSARGAGILGFSIFGAKRIYALDDDMKLDAEGLAEFLKKYEGQEILLFGFTFMVWQHFYKELVRLKEEGITFDLSRGILIHGGGWKKLAGEAVSPEEFYRRLNEVCGLDRIHDYSRFLMADLEAKQYPDVVTYAFWIRRSSVQKLRERFRGEGGNIRLGRGIAFHIAPSNVPVNYAYSLTAGLLTGNANIVRIPTKEFPQTDIINKALREVLAQEKYVRLRPYVCLVRYCRERAVNDLFSALADTRIIWGGDDTIAEIRKSPLAPRTGEVTFADRFSLAVIDSGSYLDLDERERERAAEDFYNDTYLTDQNTCTSPRLVAWMGENDRIEKAKEEFWRRLHRLVARKYVFQPIQGVNKLTSSCLTAAAYGSETASGVIVEPHMDNRLVRVKLPRIRAGLMDLKDNSGYFFEYDCADILELKCLCDDKHCQTISYSGDKEMLMPLLTSGLRGIDRVVPVGKTMDFDLLWDGYNLYERLTRIITVG